MSVWGSLGHVVVGCRTLQACLYDIEGVGDKSRDNASAKASGAFYERRRESGRGIALEWRVDSGHDTTGKSETMSRSCCAGWKCRRSNTGKQQQRYCRAVERAAQSKVADDAVISRQTRNSERPNKP